MSELTTPSEIARETLRLLASRRVSPTPDNYLQHYQEITGQPVAVAPRDAERMLQQLAAELRAQPGAAGFASALAKAAIEKDWPQYRTVLLEMLQARDSQSPAASVWSQLILDLLKQWEARHSGLTMARKRESLEKVLAIPGSDAGTLATKLRNLLTTWTATDPVRTGEPGIPVGSRPAQAASDSANTCPSAPPATAPAETEDGLAQLRELLAQTLEFAVISQLGHAPDLAAEAGHLAAAARAAVEKEAIRTLTASLRHFWFKLEVRGGDNAELHQGLLRLLRLLIDNTHDLLSEDQWLSTQVAALKQIVTGPLDLTTIGDAERRLKEVIFKQGALRNSLQEAKSALKQLIADFIDRLGDLSKSTGVYHTRLEGYAQKIRQTDDIKQLNVVLTNLLADTDAAQVDAARTRDELLAARHQVQAAETKVKALQRELEQVSGLVQEDQLTGVLNRRGLEEVYQREAARADRAVSPLCVGLLDIDNFKRLNDTHGHNAGDDALQHLVRVIKRTMRPSDVVARYGGEEFVLLLPETRLEEAVEVMVRLQHNLTKAFFLHDNDRVLITFSAGVTLRKAAEPQTSTIERADKALYQAKRNGKNRVCTT